MLLGKGMVWRGKEEKILTTEHGHRKKIVTSPFLPSTIHPRHRMARGSGAQRTRTKGDTEGRVFRAEGLVGRRPARGPFLCSLAGMGNTDDSTWSLPTKDSQSSKGSRKGQGAWRGLVLK